MENPHDTWGPAEYVVQSVLEAHRQNMLLPPDERMIGFSLVMQITDALRKHRLLKEIQE